MNSRRTAWGRRRPLPVAALVVGAIAVAWACRTPGQDLTMERQIPSLAYQATFDFFYEGEYHDAIREFQTEGRRAIKLGLSLWIDSICYHTMTGECYYHMGRFAEALEHYTAALDLYLQYSNWMNRVRFPLTIRPSQSNPMIPWGGSRRGTVVGHYPSTFQIGRGRLDNSEIIRRGGVIEDPQFWLINAQEVVRCTTVAIRRRAELLGPAGMGDQLTVNLIGQLTTRPGPPNNWSQAWIDVQLGLALAAGGKFDEAIATLKQGTIAAGRYEHPLSSTALLALGHLTLGQALAEQNPNPALFAKALDYFEEATYSAVQYPNGDVLEEAFRYATLIHMLTNRDKMYGKLLLAIRWAKVKDLRQLQASLLLLAAENAALIGRTREAAGFLDDVRVVIGRRTMGNGWIGARLNYLRALVAFQQGNIEPGSQALAAAMAYQQTGSRWMFRLGYIDRMFLRRQLSEREAMELYATLLRDPMADDWLIDPMESLTMLVTPHPGPLEHWFVAALNRGNNAAHVRAALEIGDRIRRHRFYSTLPLGGRLQSLRWTLEAPPEALDGPAKLVRQSLLVQYPAYKTISDQAEAVRTKLRAMPLVSEDSKAMEELSRQLEELGRLSLQQEVILRGIALRREPAGLVFPPVVPIEEVQAKLSDGQAVLAFLVANRQVFGFLVGDKKIARWQLTVGAEELQNRIAALLREMGHLGPNSQLGEKDLTGDGWKQSAADLLKILLLPNDGSPPAADFSRPFEELIVVPDGPLWYLPFEALQVGPGGRTLPLIAQARIRYAPTVSLAVPDGRTAPRLGNTAVVMGKLSPRDSETVTQAAFEQLAGALPGSVALKTTLPVAPALYTALVDRLIVLDDIRGWEQGPYAWAPVQLARSRSGSALADWLALPWESPDAIVLPGYHTAAESSLRGVRAGLGGGEVFLTVCGLMSTGTRTVLLSRWRPGGQSSIDLVREFVAQLPHTTAADAWQRSVLLTAGSAIDIEREPRVSLKQDLGLKATHPFFWSGYMLVDTGVDPTREVPKPKVPAPGFHPPPLPGVGGR